MNDKEDLGREGELQALSVLKKAGYTVQSPDWLAEKNGKWICVEVKKKRRFLAPPFDGHGLNWTQVFLRTKLLAATGIRTYLLIFEVPSGLVFAQWLDTLEKGRKYTTRNDVRIYPIESFKQLHLD